MAQDIFALAPPAMPADAVIAMSGIHTSDNNFVLVDVLSAESYKEQYA